MDEYQIVASETGNDDESIEMLTFSRLGKRTKEFLEKQNFIFQGCQLSLEQLLFRCLTYVDLNDLVDSDILASLANDEKIVIGGTQVSYTNEHYENYYIPRKFHFFKDILVPEEEICTFYYELMEKVIWISNPNTNGKTTVLARLAASFKSRYPHFWVLHIDLSDHTDVFEELNSTSKSFTIHDFLNRTPNALKTNFEKQLFSVSNKVLIIIDGIDEVSSEYEEQVLNFLWYCTRESNFYKIFIVNSFIALDIKLTANDICRFDLYPLSKEDQIDFFKKYWEQSLHLLDEQHKKKCEFYAQNLISEEWIDEENENVGIPLQIRMLAEVLENSENFEEEIHPIVIPKWEGCCDFLTSKNSKPLLPMKPSVVELCQLFIHKNIFKDVKTPQKRSLIRSSIQKINKLCGYYFYHLALESALTKTQRKLFTHRIKSKKVPQKLKTSGILKVVDGKVRFVHRVFAEYFLAECILKQLQKISSEVFLNFFVKKILCKRFANVHLFLGHFLKSDINSLPRENLRFIGNVLSQNYLNPYYDIGIPKGSLGFLNFIFKCFEYNGTSPDLHYARTNDDPVLHCAVKRKELKEVIFLIEKGALIDSRNRIGQTVLFWAAKQCNLDMTQLLVRNGADVKCKDDNGKTPLHLAVRQGGLDVVKYLIEQGADINSKDRLGYTPLTLGAKNGVADIVEFLVSKGADINSKSKYGSALSFAAEYGNFEIATFLVRKGVDVNLKNYLGETPLHLACMSKVNKSPICVIDAIKILIEKGADINVTNIGKQTALHYAINEDDRITIVKYLVENGIDTNRLDYNNYTPLDTAISHGAFEIVQYLKGLDPEGDNTNSLYEACVKRHLNVIKYLAEHGENFNKFNHYDKPILVATVQSIEITRLLLDHGVKVNYYTALNEAVSIGNIDTVKLLMERGACESNETVQLAAAGGHLEIVKLLVEVSNGISAVSNVGNDVEVLKYLTHKEVALNKAELLRHAASYGNISIIKCLIENGVDVNETIGAGTTALYEASQSDHLHTVKFLVKHGAKIDLGNDLFTPLQICVIKGYFHTAKFLIESGADINYNEDGYMLLNSAIVNKDFNMVKYLVQSGLRFDENYNGVATLYDAIITRQIQVLDYVLKECPHIHIEDVIASSLPSGYPKKNLQYQKFFSEILTKYALDVQLDIKNSFQMLIEAAAYHDLGFIKFLWKKGVDINGQYYEVSALYVTNYLSIAKFLVDNGADVNARTKHGRTALHAAAREKNFDIFRFLIEAGANVNVVDDHDLTPLYYAAKSGSFSKVKYLLDKGVKPSKGDVTCLDYQVAKNRDCDIFKLLLKASTDINIDVREHVLLYKAVQAHNLDIVKFLIEKDADVYFENKRPREENITNTRLSRIFCCAVEKGDLDIVKYLTGNGVVVNVKDTNGNTALHKAVQKLDADMVKFLLDNGAHVNAKNNKNCTPIQSAVEDKDLYIFKMLVKNKADINVRAKDGQSLLYSAIHKNHTRLVRYLLECGTSVNMMARKQETALEVAVAMPNDGANIIKLLTTYGANINAVNIHQSTIFYSVTDCTHSNVIETLATLGADIDRLSPFDRIMLVNQLSSHVYYKFRDTKIRLVKFLVRKGLSVVGERCCSLFQDAAANGDLEVVKYLLQQGINPDARHRNIRNFYTALHCATRGNHVEVMRYLIECGANVKSIDANGCTALCIAVETNNLAALKILTQFGVDLTYGLLNWFTSLKFAYLTGNYAVIKYIQKIYIK